MTLFYTSFSVSEAISLVSLDNPEYTEVRMNSQSLRYFMTSLGLLTANRTCKWEDDKSTIEFNNYGIKVKIIIDRTLPKETAVFIKDEKSPVITVELSG